MKKLGHEVSPICHTQWEGVTQQSQGSKATGVRSKIMIANEYINDWHISYIYIYYIYFCCYYITIIIVIDFYYYITTINSD